MPAFRELRSVDEVIQYQRRVLSRTGGRSPEAARLFHYTNIGAVVNMVRSGYMWLSSPAKMNDALEEQWFKKAGINDLNYACFSRSNQNIAMFKMYAPAPDGVMISISVSDAKKIECQKPRLVEGDTLTEEEIDAELYWIGVCYKDLESNRITTPAQENHHISAPEKPLAGSIKLLGWEFEKEVRLCARKRLYDGQRLAVKLPDKLNAVLCPGFDKAKHKAELAELMKPGARYESSIYEDWLR